VAQDTKSPGAHALERFEYKYRLDDFEYRMVRNALAWATRRDGPSRRAPRGRYFVRSLYYDSVDFQAYFEKITGVPDRVKLRVRSYWSCPRKARFLNYEIKTRSGSLVGKHVAPVRPEEHEHFANTRSWSTSANAVLDEFRRLVLLRGLEPCLLVDYEREALIPHDGGDLRITFDHDMRFAQARELYPRGCYFVRPHPRWIVMEIKVRETRSAWLEDLVARYELKSLPNSKYALGIEHTQLGIFRY
jgi:SPX domain protein involved in polyphosphate accumulation